MMGKERLRLHVPEIIPHDETRPENGVAYATDERPTAFHRSKIRFLAMRTVVDSEIPYRL